MNTKKELKEEVLDNSFKKIHKEVESVIVQLVDIKDEIHRQYIGVNNDCKTIMLKKGDEKSENIKLVHTDFDRA